MDTKELYEGIDFKRLNELRINNKNIIVKRKFYIISITLILAVFEYFMLFRYMFDSFDQDADFFRIISICFISYLLYKGLQKKFIEKYVLDFKNSFVENVLNIILQKLNLNLNLNIESKLKESEFSEGKIYTNFNHFKAEELFEGVIDGVNYKFSEVEIRRKARRVNILVIRGFYANFNYEINTDIIIDVVKDVLNDIDWLQNNNLNRDTRIKIDDADFEKSYMVYSNKPELTMELISQTFVENLKQLSSSLSSELYLTIRRGKVHIAFADGTDYFNLDYNLTIEELADNFTKDIKHLSKRMEHIKIFIDKNILEFLNEKGNISTLI